MDVFAQALKACHEYDLRHGDEKDTRTVVDTARLIVGIAMWQSTRLKFLRACDRLTSVTLDATYAMNGLICAIEGARASREPGKRRKRK